MSCICKCRNKSVKITDRCYFERKRLLNTIYLWISEHPYNNNKYELANYIYKNMCIPTWIEGDHSGTYYDTGYFLQHQLLNKRKYRKFFRSIRFNFTERMQSVKKLNQLIAKEQTILSDYKKYINNVYDLILEQIELYRPFKSELEKVQVHYNKLLTEKEEQYDCESKLLYCISNVSPQYIMQYHDIVSCIIADKTPHCSINILCKSIHTKFNSVILFIKRVDRTFYNMTNTIVTLSFSKYVRFHYSMAIKKYGHFWIVDYNSDDDYYD